ncbi:hypothetical protein [Neobacillus vireti]|uniref:DUF5655 domain-containing protein n=1 Tax=Neobacillus vireti LMG 21834 TaxID=1131730 RepID=A0AB94ILM2_9BACI|nr:hypothetical protein [Neobacillus vireti]ETI67863.1 hypothetical protein BAVI_15281 [Neobacillus vireti LMG 21834]KLT17291.1 hypothetical protein AA980_15550 [Neobacillus vireti]
MKITNVQVDFCFPHGRKKDVYILGGTVMIANYFLIKWRAQADKEFNIIKKSKFKYDKNQAGLGREEEMWQEITKAVHLYKPTYFEELEQVLSEFLANSIRNVEVTSCVLHSKSDNYFLKGHIKLLPIRWRARANEEFKVIDPKKDINLSMDFGKGEELRLAIARAVKLHRLPYITGLADAQ